MAFPVMSLCPDSKRSLNLSYFPKKHGSKVLDKGSDVVRSTNSVPDIANNKESKFYAFCRQPSFHSKSKLISPYESFVVSGFLGSKSQVQLVNSPKISCLFNDLVAGFKNCNFSSVSSSPKKKIAKEVSLADPAIVNTSEFPCVINEHRLEEQLVAGFKQSYAEVASIPIKPGRCVEVMSDRSKQNSRNSRRFQSGGRRSSSRKSNRTDRTERLNSVDDPSHSSQSQEISPNLWKDLRLNQQEKHFNRLKNLVKSTNKKLDRLCSTTANPSKPDNLLSSGSRSHSKRRSNYRSHRDGKRGLRAKNSDCDIDKINWRTGEPICDKMGGQHVGDESEESLATNLLSMEFCPQGQGTNVGDQMMQEILPIENVSRTDSRSSSPRGVRRSFSSECSMDSEDSFIIFQPSGAPSDTSSDFASDWSDYDSDDSFESDSDASDEEDSCDGKNTSSPRLKEVNDLWDREYPLKEETSAQNSKLGNKEHEKKVHFRSKPVVHRMLTWDLAYRLSRPGPWEQIARDRERFHTRIQQFECILSPVLSLTHRNKIWNRLITQQKS